MSENMVSQKSRPSLIEVPIQISRITERRQTLSPEALSLLNEYFGIKELPLANMYIEMEVRNIPTAAINALRRVISDEMQGQCLHLPLNGLDLEHTTDPYILPHFIRDRLAMIPLKPRIPNEIIKKISYDLDIINQGVVELQVLARDLKASSPQKEPLFNPTFVLAELQPGARLVLKNIRITKGYGYHHSAYQVARRSAHKHLDIEQFSDEAIRSPEGEASDYSGYKISSLLADPRHHILSAVIPAMPKNQSETRMILADGCNNLKMRLRLVARLLEKHLRNPTAKSTVSGRAQFTVLHLDNGLLEGFLQIPGETYSIGELLKKIIYEVEPNIVFVAYNLASHEKKLNLKLRHTSDVVLIMKKAVKHCLYIYDSMHQQILTQLPKKNHIQDEGYFSDNENSQP